MFISFGSQNLAEELAVIQRQLDVIKQQNAEILQIARQIMADVKIAQSDLDAAANALRALVEKLNSTDFTPLPAADQSGIVSAVTELTDVVNRITGPKIPDVPPPNPEPGPSDTPPADQPTDGGDTGSGDTGDTSGNV